MFVQCSYNVRTMAKSSYNIVRTLVVDCTNIVRTFLAIVRTLYEHCTNIVRTWYEHCTDYALYKHWPKYCTNIVWMNHRPAIYHPNSAENIKLSIPIAYNVLSEFQSLEYASARFSFLCGLCLTEKKTEPNAPFQTWPTKPLLVLPCMSASDMCPSPWFWYAHCYSPSCVFVHQNPIISNCVECHQKCFWKSQSMSACETIIM